MLVSDARAGDRIQIILNNIAGETVYEIAHRQDCPGKVKAYHGGAYGCLLGTVNSRLMALHPSNRCVLWS